MWEGVGGGNENEQLHYRKLGILIKDFCSFKSIELD